MDKLEEELESLEDKGEKEEEDEKDPDQSPNNTNKMELRSSKGADISKQSFAHMNRRDIYRTSKPWSWSIKLYQNMKHPLYRSFNFVTKCIFISMLIQLVILSPASGGLVLV
jgi:hypothetical protein